MQIRFFITVLQQMARSDPMSAVLSPGHPNSIMAEQMEAKLASLGLKSPSAAANKSPSSPGARNFRKSSDAAGFLSPNAAALYGGNNDAAAMLAAQRAKLKANRISAPGTLTSDYGSSARNFSGGNLDQVQEGRSPNLDSGSMRPKSTDGLASAASKSPRPSGPLDDTLSPITHSGNWASMVNTPLVPIFDDNTGNPGQSTLDAAAAQLASVGQDGRGVLLDQDVSKYRRKSGNPQAGPGHSSPMASPNMAAASSAPGMWNASQNDFLRQAMATSPLPGSANTGSFNMQMSPNSLAGLQSPSGGLSNPMNMQMMNAMAAMGGLGNMSAAQFITMQQQILQNQQQIAAMAAGNYQSPNQMLNTAAFRQPASGSRPVGMPGSAFQNLSPNIGMAGAAGRRSPASNSRVPLPPRSGGQQSAGSATHGEDDVADLKLLQDIPNWLRVLRLHKYTPNFEHTDWKEIVVMSEKDLEAKGVAALGARRKMLKTFEVVREKHGIPHPEGSMTTEIAEKSEGAESGEAGAEA